MRRIKARIIPGFFCFLRRIIIIKERLRRNFMKKTRILSFLIPLLSMSLIGCENAEPEAPTPITGEREYKYDRMYHWYELDSAGNVDKETKAKHTYEDVPEKSTNATCNAEGQKISKCKICGYENIDPIAKTAHSLGGGTTKTENGREYIEYECSICHEKVKNIVRFKDYVKLSGTIEDGKLSTDPVGVATWNIMLPAGDYDVYFEAKYSSSGEGKKLSERGIDVTFNDENVSFNSSLTEKDIGMSSTEYKPFTFFKITATGGIDSLSLSNAHYRFVFDLEGYITFKPVVK